MPRGSDQERVSPTADQSFDSERRDYQQFVRFSHILGSLLREVLESRFLEKTSQYRLTRAQFCLLKLVVMSTDMQVGDVARYLGVSAAAASKNVDKLQRYGLLFRIPAREDRRAKRLSASTAGRLLVREYEQVKATHIIPVLDEMGPDRVAQLCDLMTEVCSSLSERSPSQRTACLRCVGYIDADCPLGRLQGGCALQPASQNNPLQPGGAA